MSDFAPGTCEGRHLKIRKTENGKIALNDHFGRTFLEILKCDFRQIFSINRGPWGLQIGAV